MEHSTIYDAAALYDLAFSYRDFARSTDPKAWRMVALLSKAL